MVNIMEDIMVVITEKMNKKYEWGEMNEESYHSAYKCDWFALWRNAHFFKSFRR